MRRHKFPTFFAVGGKSSFGQILFFGGLCDNKLWFNSVLMFNIVGLNFQFSGINFLFFFIFLKFQGFCAFHVAVLQNKKSLNDFSLYFFEKLNLKINLWGRMGFQWQKTLRLSAVGFFLYKWLNLRHFTCWDVCCMCEIFFGEIFKCLRIW